MKRPSADVRRGVTIDIRLRRFIVAEVPFAHLASAFHHVDFVPIAEVEPSTWVLA